MDFNQVLFLQDAFRILRFHTIPGNVRQTLGDHTLGVILLCRYLKGDWSLTEAALLHDAAEVAVGDIPAPIKWRFPDFSAIIAEVEARVLADAGLVMPELTYEDEQILKAADMLELVLHAQREMSQGYAGYQAIRDRGMEYVTKLDLPAEIKSEAWILVNRGVVNVGR